MQHYRRVCVVSKDPEVEAKLKKAGIEKVLKGSEIEYHLFYPLSAPPKFDCSLMIAAGGDGTLFYAISGLVNPSTPVLHVSMGNKAFLAEVRLPELPERLHDILAGNYTLERVRKLLVRTSTGWTGNALNEALFATRTWKGVLSLQVDIEGLGQMDIVSSGVMVSTPLGSTAFCLASGGPSLDDSLPGLVVCPISARRLWPPIVVHEDRKISIRKTGGKEKPVLVLDGFVERQVEDDEVMTVTKGKETVSMIRFTKEYLMKRIQRVMSE
ncbi:MAG TPA: NAD(+)/NADH kinase [Thermoproteota archaeon]|nr:NAD(+)/NADH kinase [Thermoproteota archaeon]